MKTTRILVVGGLGMCEHCGTLLTLEDMPPDSMNADWPCPNCGKLLTGKSFGYEMIGSKWEKTMWVGKGKIWVAEKPIETFDLGSWHIIPQTPSMIL